MCSTFPRCVFPDEDLYVKVLEGWGSNIGHDGRLDPPAGTAEQPTTRTPSGQAGDPNSWPRRAEKGGSTFYRHGE